MEGRISTRLLHACPPQRGLGTLGGIHLKQKSPFLSFSSIVGVYYPENKRKIIPIYFFFFSGDPGGTDTLKAEQRQKHTQTACYNNNGNNAIDAGIESCFMNSAENTTGLNAAEPAVNRCCYMCKLPPKSLHNVVYKIIFILRQLYDLYRSVHTPRTPHTHTCAREYTLARTSAGVRTHTRTHARTHTHTHTHFIAVALSV